MGKIKRVHKKEINNSLDQARSIIRDLHEHFNTGKQYKFTERLVGSAKWNIVLKDKNGFFDLDYQLLLTKNSKKIKHFDKNVEKKTEATMIKEDLIENYILPRKIIEKQKDPNDPKIISSSRIFKEEVNNYGA